MTVWMEEVAHVQFSPSPLRKCSIWGIASGARFPPSTVRFAASALGFVIQDLGGCQNHGPFLVTLNIRCRIIMGIQKGTIILTTTHLEARVKAGQVATTSPSSAVVEVGNGPKIKVSHVCSL